MSDTEELKPDCCVDWARGVEFINSCIFIGYTNRGGQPELPEGVKAFRFCPWCGKARTERKRMSDIRDLVIGGPNAPKPPRTKQTIAEQLNQNSGEDDFARALGTLAGKLARMEMDIAQLKRQVAELQGDSK